VRQPPLRGFLRVLGERYRSSGFMLGPRLGRKAERVVFCGLTSQHAYVQRTYVEVECI
jgi:hypothetical protein